MRTTCASMIVLCLVSCCFSAQPKPSKQQYEVYSAFLSAQFRGNSESASSHLGRGRLFITPETAPFRPNLNSAERALEIRHRLPSTDRDTLQAIGECAGKTYRLYRKLTTPAPYTFVTPEEARGRAYLQFSCVGFNDAGTQAVFFVATRSSKSAIGKWVLMQKSSGKWVISKETLETTVLSSF